MSAYIQLIASSRLATLAPIACLSAGAHLLAREIIFSPNRIRNEVGKVLFDYPLSFTAGTIALSILGTGIAGTAAFASFVLLPITFKATIIHTNLSNIVGNSYPRLNKAAHRLNDVARLVAKAVCTAGCIYVMMSPIARATVPITGAADPITNIFVTALMLDKPETVLWPLAGAFFMAYDLSADFANVISNVFASATRRA